MPEPDIHRSTITVSDLCDVIVAAQETITQFEETTWWRGHANANWRLEAQIYRKNPENPDRPFAGSALIGHFVSRAPSRSHRPCPAADDYFGWLFLAQHYGLPTCLLDWTESPLIAAYFAVESSDDDGCIWALGPTGLNGALVDLGGLVMMQNPRAQKIAENAFAGNGSPDRVTIAIDGQEIDPRMLAQMSRFTVHSDSAPLELVHPDSANWLRQFVIPKRAKEKIRRQLSALGIRRSNLFPDLTSLATELKSAFW
jgi:FRG domain